MDWERYAAEKEFLAAFRVKREVAGRLHEKKWPVEEIAEVVRLSVGRTKELIEKYEKEKMNNEEE